MSLAPLARATLAACLVSVPVAAQPAAQPPLVTPQPAGATTPEPAADDTVRQRPHAVDVSSGYDRRLTIHRWGSYVMLPLFVGQYILGDQLLRQKEDAFAGRRLEPVDEGLRRAHLVTAVGVGTLFTVNTVTGAWNWYESRGVADRRTLRNVHALAMLAADVGFVATGIIGRDAVKTDVDRARTHRNVALASISVSTVSAVAMLILNRD